SPKAVLPYLERCIKEQGFSGLLLNPDPGECSGVETPALGDRFWYPLYEKMCELDIPGHIHSTGCRSERLSYSLHFINEENIAVVSLLNANVFHAADCRYSCGPRAVCRSGPITENRHQLSHSKRGVLADVHCQGRRLLPEVWLGREPCVRRRNDWRRHDLQRRSGDDQFFDG